MTAPDVTPAAVAERVRFVKGNRRLSKRDTKAILAQAEWCGIDTALDMAFERGREGVEDLLADLARVTAERDAMRERAERAERSLTAANRYSSELFRGLCAAEREAQP